ncbi:MAG: K(+)-transporting ATPase subunit F [Limnochordaceae bacterium]|nr:K(+)-transporting ATPase subunit F [Limnochordaceae bacterium]
MQGEMVVGSLLALGLAVYLLCALFRAEDL